MTYHDLNIDVRGPDDAPPLLLLHGWGSSAEHMLPVARALSDAYRTHTVDLPGHGASPPPPEPWGVPEHAQLLAAYVRDVAGPPVTVVGHSNGGRIGLYLASTPDTADLVRRLVLVSPSGITPERGWRYRLKSTTARVLKAPVQVLPDPVRAPVMDWLRHSALWRLLGSSDYNQLDGVMRETFVKTVTHHLDGPVHRIDVPTLVFWGTEDEAISRAQMRVLETAIADCGVVELDGAGHYGHLDRLDTVVRATRHFLATA